MWGLVARTYRPSFGIWIPGWRRECGVRRFLSDKRAITDIYLVFLWKGSVYSSRDRFV
jgi:hypothetical protein